MLRAPARTRGIMSEELVEAAKSRIEELLKPINDGVGEDVSYDQSFEDLKGEADKLSSLEGDPVNWGTISSLADEILTEKAIEEAAEQAAEAARPISDVRGSAEYRKEIVKVLTRRTLKKALAAQNIQASRD